jgi:2-succinyl-5-enolpyruvyl-6-hydroxy-3-cyclohexene-1-carboxylate synthase
VSTLTEQLSQVQRVQQQGPKVELETVPPSPAAWKAALFKLVVGVGALATAASVWLGARNVNLPPKVDAQQARTEVVETRTDTAATEVAALRGEVAMLKKQRQDWLVYWLELQRIQGVQVARPEGLPAASKVDVVVPLRRRGESGPSLYVNTPPPW